MNIFKRFNNKGIVIATRSKNLRQMISRLHSLEVVSVELKSRNGLYTYTVNYENLSSDYGTFADYTLMVRFFNKRVESYKIQEYHFAR